MKTVLLLSVTLLSLCAAARADEAATSGEPNCRIVHPAPLKAGERLQWKGPCKEGFADGDGVLEHFQDGAVTVHYEGKLEHGVLVQGYAKYANGARYEGPFKDGRRNGLGVFIAPNGDRYDGDWKDGKRDGRGSQAMVLGGRYDGDWKADRFDGRGALTYAGGHQVIGQFVAGTLVGAPAATLAARAPAAEREDFKIKEDHARVGSSIARDATTSNGVPFDKSYPDMTPAQQAIVRAPYAFLEPGDEPPYPLAGTKQHAQLLHEAAGKLDAPRGMLRVIVQVDASGTPQSASVYESPDPKLGEVASVMLMQTKFKPAVCGGKPCAMGYPLTMRFDRRM